MASPVELPPIQLEPLPSPREKWLQERRTFIGGSEVYELLNEQQYGKGCVRALAYRKLNTPPDYPEQLDEELLKRGNILEPVAAAMYEEQTGRKLRRPPLDEHGLPKVRRRADYPWAGVHADRIVLSGSGGVTETGTAEIKSRGEGPFIRMMRAGLFPGDNLQIQHGMFVHDHQWGPFIVIGLFGGMPLKHFDVKRDEQAIEIIKREGDKFAETVFVKGELPPPPLAADDKRCKVCAFRMTCRGQEIDAAEAAAIAAEKSGKKPLVQISNPALAQALADRELLKVEIAEREEQIEVLEEEIVLRLVGYEAAFVSGFGKTYCRDGAWSGLDQQRLKAEKPEIHQAYYVTGKRTGKKTLRTYPIAARQGE